MSKGIDILEAIDLSNLLRRVGGHKQINDLLPGEPSDPANCVLAKSFNCNCKIAGDSEEEGYLFNNPVNPFPDAKNWYVFFYEEKYAEALRKELGIDKEYIQVGTFQIDEYESFRKFGLSIDEVKIEYWGVPLPAHVALIATAFDEYELDPKYYEANYEKKTAREHQKMLAQEALIS